MYNIISNLISGDNSIIVAVSGVVVIVLFAELCIMISKFFRFFMK